MSIPEQPGDPSMHNQVVVFPPGTPVDKDKHIQGGGGNIRVLTGPFV